MLQHALAVLVVSSAALTAAQPLLVHDIRPGSASSGPQNLIAVGSTLFFTAHDGTTGVELWKSDGTAPGTMLVKDLTPGSGSTQFRQFAVLNGTLFFNCNGGGNGLELWTSDGTNAGTVMVAGDLNPGASDGCGEILGVFGGTLFFQGDDGSTGPELWRTTGTAASTRLVADIVPGSRGSGPRTGVVLGGSLLFYASTLGAGTTNLGSELYKTDGTAAGTMLVKDINPGSANSAPMDLMVVNGYLWFSADDGTHGRELWWSDGTTAGTVLVKDIFPGADSSRAKVIGIAAGVVFVQAIDRAGGTTVLYRTNGTPAGTALVKDLQVRSPVHELSGKGYVVLTDPAVGAEIFITDGTPAGTTLLIDLFPGPSSGGPPEFFSLPSVGNLMVFAGSSGFTGPGHGPEPWRSNGTAARTELVLDIYPGMGGSSPRDFTRMGRFVYFSASDGLIAGRELWRMPVRDFCGATAERYGSGCPGSNGVPSLDPAGLPDLGNAGFAVGLSSAAPSAPVAVVLGTSPASIPVGPCRVLVLNPPVILVLTTSATGTLNLGMAIPNVPALLCGELYMQAWIADPMGAFNRVANVSNGLRLVVGH